MKKETRVKDLPEILRSMIQRITPDVDPDNLNAEQFLKSIDFTKATDAERLAYCEVRYPKGTKFKSAGADSEHISSGKMKLGDVNAGYIYNALEGKKKGIVYNFHSGKFAEIIEDEVKEPKFEVENWVNFEPSKTTETLFKVGDRPKWTPELIKQLPHGTVLECANDRVFHTYNGQEIIKKVSSSLTFFQEGRLWCWFYHKSKNRYAKIISLPETQSIKEKLKGTCVLNEKEGMGAEIVKLYTEAGFENPLMLSGTIPLVYYGGTLDSMFIYWASAFGKSVLTLDQLRSIVRGEKQTESQSKSGHDIDFLYDANKYIMCNKFKEYHEKTSKELREVKAESVEFKEGEMVEYWHGIHEKWISQNEPRYTGGKSTNGRIILEDLAGFFAVDKIRKIDADPHGFLKTANEIISERIEHKPFHEDSVRDMLIEMAKRVKK